MACSYVEPIYLQVEEHALPTLCGFRMVTDARFVMERDSTRLAKLTFRDGPCLRFPANLNGFLRSISNPAFPLNTPAPT